MDKAAETHLVDGRPYWGIWANREGIDKLYFCKKYAIPEEIGSEVFDVNAEELSLEDDRFKEDIDKETEKEVFYTSEKVREFLRTDEGLIKLSDIWRSALQTFYKDEGVKINYHKWRANGTLCGIQTFSVGCCNQFWIRGENVDRYDYKTSYGLPDMDFDGEFFRDYHFYLHCIIYSLYEGKGDWSKESVVGKSKEGLLDFFWGIYKDRILKSIKGGKKRVYEESGKIATEIRDKWIELWSDHRNIGLFWDGESTRRLVVRLPVILSFGLHNEYKSLSEPQKVRLSKLLFESFRRNVDDLTSTFITSNSSDQEPGEFERQMRKQYGVMYLDFIFDFNVESELRLVTREVKSLTGKDYIELFATLRPKPEIKELPDGTTQKIYPDIPTIKDGRQTSGIEKRIATYLNDRGCLVITEPMIDFPNPDMNYKLPDLMVMDKGRTLAIEIDDISHLIDYETREGTWGNANIKKWKTDRKMDEYLLCLGIPMLRVWKFDVERSPEIVVEKVARIFESLGGMRMTYR